MTKTRRVISGDEAAQELWEARGRFHQWWTWHRLCRQADRGEINVHSRNGIGFICHRRDLISPPYFIELALRDPVFLVVDAALKQLDASQ